MQKPHFDRKKKLWYRQFTCHDELCISSNGGKKKRHIAYEEKRKDLTANKELEVARENHKKLAPKLSGIQRVLRGRVNSDGTGGVTTAELTFKDVAEEVLADISAMRIKKENHSSYINHLQAYNNYLYPMFDRDLISNISSNKIIQELDKLTKRMLKDKYKEATLKSIDTALAKVCKKASMKYGLPLLYDERVKWQMESCKELLRNNVADKPEIDPVHIKNFVYFVRHINDTVDADFKMLSEVLLVALHLGTRGSETAGITTDAINLGSTLPTGEQFPHIIISEQLRYVADIKGELSKAGYTTGIISKDLKGDNPIHRKIKLSDELQGFFRSVIIEYEEGIRQADILGRNSIWQHDNGKPMVLYNFQNELDKFLKKYGQDFHEKHDREFTGSIHNLRHACISFLLGDGASPTLVGSIAGHKNYQTTDMYTHTYNKQLNQLPNLSTIFKGV